MTTQNEPKELTGKEILDIPMQENDAEAGTIGEYLIKLLEELWFSGEGFSGKRPFGNSGWCHELYNALAKAKAITSKYDEVCDEYYCYDDAVADKLINKAIAALYESK